MSPAVIVQVNLTALTQFPHQHQGVIVMLVPKLPSDINFL